LLPEDFLAASTFAAVVPVFFASYFSSCGCSDTECLSTFDPLVLMMLLFFFAVNKIYTIAGFRCLNLWMRTMEEYDALDDAEKSAFILQGEFLADREENGLVVQLYSVGSFYGELYYDPLANKILRWRAFEGTLGLGPYLAHIRFNTR